MKLVDDVKGVWKHYSTIALVTAVNLQGAWVAIPDEIKADLPSWVHKVVAWVVFTVVSGGFAGKFIDQGKPNESKSQSST